MDFLLVLPNGDFAKVMDSVRRSHRIIVGVGGRLATSIVIELIATVLRLKLMILNSLVPSSLEGRGSRSEECSKQDQLCCPVFVIFPGALASLNLLKSGQVEISDLVEIVGPNDAMDKFIEHFQFLTDLWS